MRLSYLIAFLGLVHTALAASAPAPAPGWNRVRRPWSQYNQQDKDLYTEAVALGMKRGFHQRFVEMHMDDESNWEAHDGFFFYWHRAYLVAYENMLRSLDPKFACITIPYWDYATLGAKFAAGSCTDMLNCGSILQDFGGSLPASRNGPMNVTVNGAKFQSDNCVVSRMTENFCQNSTAWEKQQCLKCVPRNDWSLAQVPPDVNVLNVFNNVMGNIQLTLEGVTSGVQWGTHNMVHAALNSMMGTFAAPGDPIFYAHHGTTDALHAIYHNCAVKKGPAVKGPAVKDPRLWTECRNSLGKTIEATDQMTMKVGVYGSTESIWTATTNPIYPFFKDLNRTYLNYSDISNLGANSYSYDFSGTMLDGMNAECLGFKPSTSLFLSTEEAEPDFFWKWRGHNSHNTGDGFRFNHFRPNYRPTPAPYTTTPTPYMTTKAPTPTPTKTIPTPTKTIPTPTKTIPTPTKTPIPTPTKTPIQCTAPPPYKATKTPAPTLYSMKNTPVDTACVTQEVEWLKEATRLASKFYTRDRDINNQVQMMLCVYYNECLGGVFDYAPEFKKKFHATQKPPCKTIIDNLATKQIMIGVAGWEKVMINHYPCNAPSTTF